MLKLRSISPFLALPALPALPALLALLALGCGSAPDSTSDTAAALATTDDPTPPPSTPPPHLQDQNFVLYVSARAEEEVVLKKDGSYLTVEGIATTSGTWAFDAAQNAVTLTPADGSAAPPPFKPVTEQCDHGWFTAIVRGNDRFIPWGIDPEFERQYCHLAN